MSLSALDVRPELMRSWSRKFTTEQISAVLSDYQSGQFTGPQLQRRYGIGHNTLYRWVRKFKALPDPRKDPAYLQQEVTRLKALVVELALANKQLADERRAGQH